MCATTMFSFGVNFSSICSKKTESGPPEIPTIKVSPPFKCFFKVSSVFWSAVLLRFRGMLI